MELHYLTSGLIVLTGSIALIKCFDFLAVESTKRLLEMAHGCKAK